MAFKDKLRKILEERGLIGEEELVKIVRIARKTAPEFSMRRFTGLLHHGHPPKPIELDALSLALNVHPREFLEGTEAIQEENKARILKFASERMHNSLMAERFLGYVRERTKFRHAVEVISYDELYALAHEFLDEIDEEESDLQKS